MVIHFPCVFYDNRKKNWIYPDGLINNRKKNQNRQGISTFQ